jgi:HEAT repeat protein
MSTNTENFDIKKLIADYMEDGMLDNIVDMFKHDRDLYAYIGELMSDERIVVRIGVTALVETLRSEDSKNVSRALPSIIPLLEDQNPMLRGDAAYLLGIIGDKDAIPFLRKSLEDEHAHIRTIVQESLEEIETNPIH